MSLIGMPISEIAAVAEHEFDKPCEATDTCDRTAEWVVWVKHNRDHESWSGFSCLPHKDVGEQTFIAVLVENVTCSCGHRHEGQLSDNFRAIRL